MISAPAAPAIPATLRGWQATKSRITLELPTALAPDGEATRRNLRIVQPERIAIYRTDPSLQNLGGVDGVSTRTDAEGYTIITFEGGQPLAPDIVIEASYGNTRLRALASDSDRDIKINPFSEYLVRDILGSYTPGEWQAILDCADDERCLNRYVWPTLSDQIHDFEIDIPDNAGLTEALALLRSPGRFYPLRPGHGRLCPAGKHLVRPAPGQLRRLQRCVSGHRAGPEFR